MKESSVVHAYRSPLSPPSLPLPGSLVAPRYVAKEGGVGGGGCNGHVGAFLRASLARAMFCSDNPISHGRTRSLARLSALLSIPSSPLLARVSCEIACGGEVTPRGRARVRRVDADLGEIVTRGNCPPEVDKSGEGRNRLV